MTDQPVSTPFSFSTLHDIAREVDAIAYLRDAHPELSLLDAKNIVEYLQGKSKVVPVQAYQDYMDAAQQGISASNVESLKRSRDSYANDYESASNQLSEKLNLIDKQEKHIDRLQRKINTLISNIQALTDLLLEDTSLYSRF